MKTLFLILFLLVGCGVKMESEGDSFHSTPTFPGYIPYNLEDIPTNDADIMVFANELYSIIEDEDVQLDTKTVHFTLGDLSDQGPKVLGQCRIYDNVNVIIISDTFWATAADWKKRNVVYHEMGHCVLGRMTHRTLYYNGPGVYDGGIVPAWPLVSRYLPDSSLNPDYRSDWPLSMMGTKTLTEDQFTKEFDYYVFELIYGD